MQLIAGRSRKKEEKGREVDGSRHFPEGKRDGLRSGICHMHHIAGQKHRAWKAADSVKTAGFGKGEAVVVQKIAAVFGPHGIAAEHTAKEDKASGAGQPQKSVKYRIKRSGKEIYGTEAYHKVHADHKGQQGREYCVIP